jgi:hypothetical protein
MLLSSLRARTSCRGRAKTGISLIAIRFHSEPKSPSKHLLPMRGNGFIMAAMSITRQPRPILVAKSFVRLITRWVAEAPLGYAERHWVIPA